MIIANLHPNGGRMLLMARRHVLNKEGTTFGTLSRSKQRRNYFQNGCSWPAASSG